ncbi:MAG: methyltransferase, partial [Persicimonas sp.]
MSPKTINLDDELHHYLLSVSGRESEPLRRLREATAERSDSNMMTAPEQGQFLYLLARLSGAQRAIEVGTYTGYGTLWIA